MKHIAYVVLGLLAWSQPVLADTVSPNPGSQPCPGMMGGYGMPMMGMMRGGQVMMMPMMMGPGWGGGWGANKGALNLSAADVKGQLERWVTWNGNQHLKVGKVVEKDTNTITAEITTQDNSLVQLFTVDRHTGLYSPAP